MGTENGDRGTGRSDHSTGNVPASEFEVAAGLRTRCGGLLVDQAKDAIIDVLRSISFLTEDTMAISAFAHCRILRGAPLIALSLLAGCGDEFLIADYEVGRFDARIVRQVQSGTLPIANPSTGLDCSYSVDTNSGQLRSRESGSLGQSGFAVTITIVGTPNSVTTNPASCPALGDVQLNVGSPTEALDVGSTTIRGSFNANADGTAFSSAGAHFTAEITGQSADGRTVFGTFEAIAPATGSNPGRMIYAKGSFKVR